MITRRFFTAAALAVASRPAAAQGSGEPGALRLATGAAGGTFFDYGAGIAKLVGSRTGLRLAAVPSGGSIENLRRIEDGSADLALVAMGPAFEAWNASAAPWTGKPPLRRARALLPMYETPFHLAAVEASGLRTARDLDGRRVGVGPRGGANEQIFGRLTEGLGIKPTLVFGDPGELADKVVAREVDALFFGAGAPIPAYRKIAEAAPIRFLPLDGEAGAALRGAFPYLAVNAIPGGTYKGQPEAVPTVALWNFVVARDDLPADQAYDVVKAVLSDRAAAQAIHPAATATVAANAGANGFMPFHPGAVRYYDEVKVLIAGALR